MTPVQASTIPQFMMNKDVVVEAVTGSCVLSKFSFSGLPPELQEVAGAKTPFCT